MLSCTLTHSNSKGELDPREIICLYPDMQFGLSEDFRSLHDQTNKSPDLQVLWQQDRNTFHHYLAFLGEYLRAVRELGQVLGRSTEVDCALLRRYAEQGARETLQQLVAFPNACSLSVCVPVLQHHNR